MERNTEIRLVGSECSRSRSLPDVRKLSGKQQHFPVQFAEYLQAVVRSYTREKCPGVEINFQSVKVAKFYFDDTVGAEVVEIVELMVF